MSVIGSHAMVLAAGLGTRMRPLTDDRPKPLVEVGGRCLIDYGFDRIRAAGVETAVVNVHYFPDQVEAWARLQPQPRVVISDERGEILDTGGGIAKALPLLGCAPFFTLNSDSFWLDNRTPALNRLSHAWSDSRMDALLLLCSLDSAVGYDGKGDFQRLPDGRLERRAKDGPEGLVYIGCQLVHPRLFGAAPQGKFSMNVLWDKAIVEGRLFGVVHDGVWLHVGTPEAIPLAEAALRA